jgi:hypothetical protein
MAMASGGPAADPRKTRCGNGRCVTSYHNPVALQQIQAGHAPRGGYVRQAAKAAAIMQTYRSRGAHDEVGTLGAE